MLLVNKLEEARDLTRNPEETSQQADRGACWINNLLILQIVADSITARPAEGKCHHSAGRIRLIVQHDIEAQTFVMTIYCKMTKCPPNVPHLILDQHYTMEVG